MKLEFESDIEIQIKRDEMGSSIFPPSDNIESEGNLFALPIASPNNTTDMVQLS